MAYALKYKCTFDPFKAGLSSPYYTLDILQKDYSGAASNITGAADVLRHSWDTDEPKPAIKGSSLKLNFLNKDRQLPLTNFYSIADDEYKVQLYWLGQLLFEGFIVQDDCIEEMLDTTHPVQIAANDNLGLLKDVPLDKTGLLYQLLYESPGEEITTTAPHTITFPFPTGIPSQVQIGDRIQIQGAGIADGTYTVNGVSGGNISVNEFIPTTGTQTPVLITLFRKLPTEKTTLLSVIKACLQATGLRLDTHIFANIYTTGEVQTYGTSFGANAAAGIIQLTIPATVFTVGQTFTVSNSLFNNGTFTITAIDPLSFFARLTVSQPVVDENNTQEVVVTVDSQTWCFHTLVNVESFLKSDTEYDNCYSILEKILGRFNCTLFQANGVWKIVKWSDLRYYLNIVPGFVFDADMGQTGTVNLDEPLLINWDNPALPTPDIYPVTGYMNRIFRPFKSVKETFNYKQPYNLLRNWNLQQLGMLLNTYTVGSGTALETVSEYAFPWWVYEDAFPSASGVNGAAVYLIRVILDYLGNEIDRHVVLKNNHIHSYKIEANQGDTFTFSFSAKTADTQPLGTVVLIAKLTNGITTVFAQDLATHPTSAGWGAGLGFNYVVGTPDSSNWFNISYTVEQIPFDGELTLYLQNFSVVPSHETFYKDIRLEYFFSISGSTKIIGHTHYNVQPPEIKNKEEEEIYIDSSPRNSIAGTLFLPSMTGLLQTRTQRWKRAIVAEALRLGEITTFETLFWRRLSRTILEGTIIGLIKEGKHVSMVSVFNYDQKPGLNFNSGRLEIDYKNNSFTGTQWENHNAIEADGDIIHDYLHAYLYAAK